MSSFVISASKDGIVIALKVVPGASRTKIAGILGDALKIAVSKPPSGGEANRAVVEVLAAALGIAKKDVEIIAGHSSPRKQARVRGVTVDQVQALATKPV